MTAATWQPTSGLAYAVDLAGFSYDPVQDIIYSKLDAWQRATGFCSMYDDTAPTTISAYIDCEPIRFQFASKTWMIEFWKGQYGIETGAEIGVYNLPASISIHLPKLADAARSLPAPVAQFFLDKAKAVDSAVQSTLENGVAQIRGDWLACADDADCLQMSFTLYKNNKVLFQRTGRHWWLTGFRWGEFSDPSQLRVEATIQCLSPEMLHAFTAALTNWKYTWQTIDDRTISLTFDKPRTPQPSSRQHPEALQQRNNLMVQQYNQIKAACHAQTNDPNLLSDDASKFLIEYFSSFLSFRSGILSSVFGAT